MDQQKVWDSISESWSKRRKKLNFQEVLDFQKNREGMILDVGCGSGRNLLKNKRYVCLDFSRNMLKYAKKRSKNTLFIRADAVELPLKNNSFNTILYVAILHVIRNKKNRKKALLELKRVMKKNGKAIITVWNKDQPRFFKKKKESYIPWKHKGKAYMRYYYLYDMKELERLLKSAGFKIVSITGSEKKAFDIFARNIVAVVRK
jgi:ubiquinone/menaquinone biosynthesis C-methylase UbiE